MPNDDKQNNELEAVLPPQPVPSAPNQVVVATAVSFFPPISKEMLSDASIQKIVTEFKNGILRTNTSYVQLPHAQLNLFVQELWVLGIEFKNVNHGMISVDFSQWEEKQLDKHFIYPQEINDQLSHFLPSVLADLSIQYYSFTRSYGALKTAYAEVQQEIDTKISELLSTIKNGESDINNPFSTNGNIWVKDYSNDEAWKRDFAAIEKVRKILQQENPDCRCKLETRAVHLAAGGGCALFLDITRPSKETRFIVPEFRASAGHQPEPSQGAALAR